jgi:cyclopropane-fatty-acyl-phospholipid synthase
MQATRRGASPEAIQSHYDAGNEFYELWLDPTLCYSCALWNETDTDDDLEQAQLRKLDHHILRARAAGVGRVLDVGCGWGTLLARLIETHGVERATGLTLSQQQAMHVSGRRLPGVDVRLEAWEDHVPDDPYDAIISIGAFEHFARPEWTEAEKVAAYRAFFGRCHDWLVPGGSISLQTIAYGNLDRETSRQSPGHAFLLHEIFPETDVPTLANLVEAADGLFEIVTLQNDREDYRRTCRVWQKRLLARRAEAEALVGSEIVARYLRYLKLSATLFHSGYAYLLRLSLRRLDEPRRER